jgi:hypothetical protein
MLDHLLAEHQNAQPSTNLDMCVLSVGDTARFGQRLRTFLDGFDSDPQVSLFDFESNWDTLHGGAYMGIRRMHAKCDFVLDRT